jgi:hypothetical protein
VTSPPENARLLFGPYTAPALKRGDRATCLLRDGDVVITSWSAGRIPWPRCRAVDAHGGSGLLVDEELARAIRTESAAALMYWWGVGQHAVWHWRKALGVGGHTGTEGTRRLVRAASASGADTLRGKPLPPWQVERRRQTAEALHLGQHLKPGYHGPCWTDEELALLGTDTDEAVAAQFGRTEAPWQVERRRQTAEALS